MTTALLLDKLGTRYELAVYLSKLLKSKDPFKKELSPSLSVKEAFFTLFKSWLEEQVGQTVSGAEEQKKVTDSFTPQEIIFLKQFASRSLTRAIPGAAPQQSRAVPPPPSGRLRPIMGPATSRIPTSGGEWRVGENAYLIDPSTVNHPDVMAGSTVQIICPHPKEAGFYMVRVAGKSAQFTTSAENLTREKIV